MAEEKLKQRTPHTLMLDCRKCLTLSGVNDVGSFDEEAVTLYTDYGELNIRGSKLHITKLSLDTKEVSLDGEIASLIYTGNQPQKVGIISKLFR